MRPSEDLFQLIQSMSQAEKRQFKRAASRTAPGEAHSYLRLFDYIARQDAYDEAAVKAHFADEAFVRNFSVAKGYLYQSILQSLCSPRKPSSVEMALRRSLDEIEELQRRGLMNQAEKILKKAMPLAKAHQLSWYTAELIQWQSRLANLPKLRGGTELLMEWETQKAEAIQEYGDETQLFALLLRIRRMLISRPDIRQPETAQRLEELMAHPLLQASPQRLSFFGRIPYHYIHAIYHRLQGDLEGPARHYGDALAVWEDAPIVIQNHPNRYLNSVVQYLDACLRVRWFPEFLRAQPNLERLQTAPLRVQARAFYLGQHLQLRFASNTYQFQLGMDQRETIEKGLVRFQAYLSKNVELTLLFNLASVHFVGEDFSTLIRLANQLLGKPNPALREDIYDALRLMELVAHYERGNVQLVDSLLRSHTRRLKNRSQPYPFEERVLEGIKELARALPDDLGEILEKMEGELEQISGGKLGTGQEEMLLWVQARRQGCSIGEVMGRKE